MDKILKYTTLIYALLVFLGCASQFFFYSKFNVNIIGYLNFNDAILSFLPTIISLLVLFFLACFIFYFYKLWIHEKIKKLPRKKQGLIFLTVFLFLLIFPCALLLPFNFSLHKIVMYYVFLVLPTFIYLLDDFFKKINLYNKIVWKYIFIIFILAILMVLSIQYATLKADDLIKERTINENTSFIYEGQTIETNEDLILIGSTSDHIFLYDKVKRETSVYEKSNVRFLKFKN